MRCPRLRLHLGTVIVLMLVAGGLLWANFRDALGSIEYADMPTNSEDEIACKGFVLAVAVLAQENASYGWPWCAREPRFNLDSFRYRSKGWRPILTDTDSDSKIWHWFGVLGDCAVALAVLVIVGTATEHLLYRQRRGVNGRT